jgi:endonuclease YncB( thermonuclease family)
MRSGLALACAFALAMASVAAAEDKVPPAARNVTAPGMTPGPAIQGPLEREPVPPPLPDPPRWHRFFLPETSDAGTFKVKALTIHISGLAPPAADEGCGAENARWPCGKTALLALRMYLRGRAVECYYPKLGDAELVVAPCRVATSDLGLWLLGRGWAKPDGNATDEYRAAAREAACAGRGLWRDDKPADCN